jgi:hypothetical protein
VRAVIEQRRVGSDLIIWLSAQVNSATNRRSLLPHYLRCDPHRPDLDDLLGRVREVDAVGGQKRALRCGDRGSNEAW